MKAASTQQKHVVIDKRTLCVSGVDMGTNHNRGPFTRQQIAAMTGVDDSTLNYWAREGVLRASEGGGGKGQHRRFPGCEVNLAAILERLRNFGVNIVSLRQIADMCHVATDYISVFGFSEEEEEAFSSIINERRRFLRDGHCEWTVTRSEPIPEFFEGMELHYDTDRPHSTPHVRLTWEQNIEYWRQSGNAPDYTDKLWRLAEQTDPIEYQRQSYIERIFSRVPDKLYSSDLDYFYRNPQGNWVISANFWAAERGETDTFIAIDIDRVFYPIWHGKEAAQKEFADAQEKWGVN